jgi:hypothetical protein
MYLLKHPITVCHYLIYLCYRTFKGEGQAILNIIYFLYILEISAPFAYYFSSGLPLYISCIFSAILAFYNDYVYNSEIVEEIEEKFDRLRMKYFFILIQFIVFIFIPFIIFFSFVKI